MIPVTLLELEGLEMVCIVIVDVVELVDDKLVL